MVTIRQAAADDLSAITEIYNEAILKTVATFDTRPKTPEELEEWFSAHDHEHPLLVAELESRVLGWASLTEWSDRCAYSNTAELSFYVKEEHQGKGVGRSLLKAIVQGAEEAGIHTIIARITEGNRASIRLHEDEGFQHIGIMREVGRKFGRLLDVHLLQKIFRERITR